MSKQPPTPSSKDRRPINEPARAPQGSNPKRLINERDAHDLLAHLIVDIQAQLVAAPKGGAQATAPTGGGSANEREAGK